MIRLFESGKISEKYMKITINRLKELIKEELNEARGWGAEKPNLEEKLTKADKKRKKELEDELDTIQHK